MNRVALLIGGNQGDRRKLIEEATVLIQRRIGTVALASGIYETEPWGDFGDERPQNFLNRALLVETLLSAHEVLREALSIEADLGRLRPSISSNSSNPRNPSRPRSYHSRPMDIDLIFFNEEIIDTEDLTIPHPRAHLRRFVLEPLAEIMPSYRHPTLGLTVGELLQQQQ